MQLIEIDDKTSIVAKYIVTICEKTKETENSIAEPYVIITMINGIRVEANISMLELSELLRNIRS